MFKDNKIAHQWQVKKNNGDSLRFFRLVYLPTRLPGFANAQHPHSLAFGSLAPVAASRPSTLEPALNYIFTLFFLNSSFFTDSFQPRQLFIGGISHFFILKFHKTAFSTDSFASHLTFIGEKTSFSIKFFVYFNKKSSFSPITFTYTAILSAFLSKFSFSNISSPSKTTDKFTSPPIFIGEIQKISIFRKKYTLSSNPKDSVFTFKSHKSDINYP